MKKLALVAAVVAVVTVAPDVYKRQLQEKKMEARRLPLQMRACGARHAGRRKMPAREMCIRDSRSTFQLTPRRIIESLDLRRPIYRATSNYGHFGRSEPGFTWERTDKAETLRREAGQLRGAEAPARR